jgi:O-antigen ligase
VRTISAVALTLIVIFATLTSWVQATWPTMVPEAAVFLLMAAWMMAGFTGKVRLHYNRLMLPLGSIVLWGALQIAAGTTANPFRTKVAALYWGCNAATFFVALQIFSSRQVRNWLVHALVFFSLALSIAAPLQALYGGDKVFGLFEPYPNFIPQFGPFPYKNQYSAFMELLLPVALFGALTEERRRTLYVLAATVMYASVIAAASRMGFFLATAEMVAVPAILYGQRKLRLRSLRNNALLFAGIFVMLIAAAGPAEMLTRFQKNDPYAGRREYSEASLRMIQVHPLMGFGLGTWDAAYPGYATSDEGLHVNQAHDDWVQWAAEGGLLFFALMLWILVWTAPRALRSGWGIGVVAIFVHCVVDYPIQRIPVALMMFIMLAAVASTSRQVEEPR